MLEKTRAEYQADMLAAQEAERVARVAIAKIDNKSQSDANKSLAKLCETIEELLEEARDFANKHELEFSIDTSWTSVEFEAEADGNWNQSTC